MYKSSAGFANPALDLQTQRWISKSSAGFANPALDLQIQRWICKSSPTSRGWRHPARRHARWVTTHACGGSVAHAARPRLWIPRVRFPADFARAGFSAVFQRAGWPAADGAFSTAVLQGAAGFWRAVGVPGAALVRWDGLEAAPYCTVRYCAVSSRTIRDIFRMVPLQVEPAFCCRWYRS